jgi:glutamine synthetase
MVFAEKFSEDVPLLITTSLHLFMQLQAFVAGLLQCLPSMLMFTAPSVNSFERSVADLVARAYP